MERLRIQLWIILGSSNSRQAPWCFISHLCWLDAWIHITILAFWVDTVSGARAKLGLPLLKSWLKHQDWIIGFEVADQMWSMTEYWFLTYQMHWKGRTYFSFLLPFFSDSSSKEVEFPQCGGRILAWRKEETTTHFSSCTESCSPVLPFVCWPIKHSS